jgi:hypothetical protein
VDFCLYCGFSPLEFIFTFAVCIVGKIAIKPTLIREWKSIWDECFHDSGLNQFCSFVV